MNFIQNINTVYPLNAFNDVIVEFTEANAVKAKIEVSGFDAFEISGLNGYFYFNFKEIFKVIINQNLFADTTLVGNWTEDNSLFKKAVVMFKTYDELNNTLDQKEFTYKFKKSVTQIEDDAFTKILLHEDSEFDLFEGFPFDISVYNNFSNQTSDSVSEPSKNLLRNSKLLTNADGYSSWFYDGSGGLLTGAVSYQNQSVRLDITAGSASSPSLGIGNLILPAVLDYSQIKNKIITISYDVRVNSQRTVFASAFSYQGLTALNAPEVIVNSGETKRITITFQLENIDYTDLYFYAFSSETWNSGDWMEISNFKLEIGNTETFWTPAPEDTNLIGLNIDSSTNVNTAFQYNEGVYRLGLINPQGQTLQNYGSGNTLSFSTSKDAVLTLTSRGLSVRVNLHYHQKCSGLYLKWLNVFSGWDYFLFTDKFKVNPKDKALGEVYTGFDNIQNLSSFTSQLGKQVDVTFTIVQDFLNESQFCKISKIMFSPKVYMWTGKKWIEVKIDSKTKYNNKAQMGKVEFDLTLPERVTQTI